MSPELELVSIGNELLSGRTVNTHAQTLGALLAPLGIRLMRDTTVPDEPALIRSAVREAFGRVDIVLVSGGLGPTPDDITREALAQFAGCGIVSDAAALADLTAKYRRRDPERVITAAAARQALVLEGAEVLLNPVGIAPGERLEVAGGKTLFILPGPPAEFEGVLKTHIVPWLRGKFGAGAVRPERVLQTGGIGESDLITLFEANGFPPPEITACYYPGGGRVEIRLSSEPEDEKVLDSACAKAEVLLRKFSD